MFIEIMGTRRQHAILIAMLCLVTLACSLSSHAAAPTAIPAQAISVVVTNTPNSTAPPTPLPTATPKQSTAAQTVNITSNCKVRTDWYVYTVVVGDTLAILAEQTGTTVEGLRLANCLNNSNLIYVGQRLYVPVMPVDQAPDPASIKLLGKVTVSPTVGTDSGWLLLQPGSLVTLSWQGAETLSAVDVYFGLAPTGTGMRPSVIAEDHNLSDGVSAQWTIPTTGTGGYLSAWATTQGGRVIVAQTAAELGVSGQANNTGIPQITSFSVSPNPVRRGGTVTISWSTIGANSVRIDREAERGIPIYSDDWGKGLPPSGSLSYVLPPDYINTISFILSPSPDGPSARASTSILCDYSRLLIMDCPLDQQSGDLVYQVFEGGYMIWRQNFRQVYVLYNDSTWQVFEDTWQGEPIYPSMPEDGSIPCPSLRPQRALGKIWYTTQPTVRERLGCPVAEEITYNTVWEVHTTWPPDRDISDVYHVFREHDHGLIVLDIGDWHTLD
jgi:LysM repeat protein